MSDAEVMARIAPAARPVNYGGRVQPDFARMHAELKRPNMTLMLASGGNALRGCGGGRWLSA